jgi:serine/threonine protein kinase
VLARTIEFAHRKGVLHRDLKPSNVLLTAEGTPKIADFGLATRIGLDNELTGTGTLLGTPSYMAPEQAQKSAGRVGPAADVYGLGSILYELLTGRPPFTGESPLDVLSRLAWEEPVSPRRFQPAIPCDLETVTLKCLEKDPGRRYASAGALAEDLMRFLAGEPVQARPIGPIGWATRWAGRNPVLVSLFATVGSLLCAVVVLAAVVLSFWREARAEQALHQQPGHPPLVAVAAEARPCRAELGGGRRRLAPLTQRPFRSASAARRSSLTPYFRPVLSK